MRQLLACFGLCVLLGYSSAYGGPLEREQTAKAHAWNLEEARDAWARCPQDSYLQFVVLKLTESDPERQEEIARTIRWNRDWRISDPAVEHAAA